jgi:hypothetical protein
MGGGVGGGLSRTREMGGLLGRWVAKPGRWPAKKGDGPDRWLSIEMSG